MIYADMTGERTNRYNCLYYKFLFSVFVLHCLVLFLDSRYSRNYVMICEFDCQIFWRHIIFRMIFEKGVYIGDNKILISLIFRKLKIKSIDISFHCCCYAFVYLLLVLAWRIWNDIGNRVKLIGVVLLLFFLDVR